MYVCNMDKLCNDCFLYAKIFFLVSSIYLSDVTINDHANLIFYNAKRNLLVCGWVDILNMVIDNLIHLA